MLRYDRQTKSGLVAVYDIWPGNGVGLFLQPLSPHRAIAVGRSNLQYAQQISSEANVVFRCSRL